MPISSTTVWEIRATGNDTNGGGYNPAALTTDYSQQDTPQLEVFDVATNGTATVTSATGGFTPAMVGNLICIAGSDYEITARTNTNTISVSPSPPAGSLQLGRVGGAKKSLGAVGKSFVSGNYVWLKGALLVTSTTPNVAGGPLDLAVRTVGGLGTTAYPNGNAQIRGYGTTRGDSGTASITASGIAPSGTLALLKAYQFTSVFNITANGAGISNVRGFDSSSSGGANYLRFCIARSCTNYGILAWTEVEGCGLINNSGQSGLDSCQTVFDSWGYGQSGGEGLFHARSGVVDNCWGWNCTGGNFTFGADNGGRIWNCRVANCLRGISWGSWPRPARLRNNIVWGCTQWNYFLGPGALLNSCASGGGAVADTTGYSYLSLSANPFLDAANGDLRLNPNAIASLYAQGFPIRSDWMTAPPIRRYLAA